MIREFYITDDLIASQGQRLANYFIDLAFRYLILFVIAIILAFIGEATGNYGITDWLENISTVQDYLISFTTAILYYLIMESLLSKSLGKYITKTMVVMEDGTKPDFQTIFKRTFCRLIPFDGLSFLGTPPRGWHDTISNTCVVKKDLFDEKVRLFYSLDEIGVDAEN